MKYILLTFLTFISTIIFAQSENRFNETPDKIKKYRQLSQFAWDKNDSTKAISYDDSIKNCIEGSIIDKYSFKTFDDKILNTQQIERPIFLLTSASWCSPCMAEISPLNKLVEKYRDSIQFIVLFWDTKDKVADLSTKYNSNIILVPSLIRDNTNDNSLNISGFQHIGGYPATYLILKNRIIDYAVGAVSPTVTILNSKGEFETKTVLTEEEVFKANYELLKSKIDKLLHSNYP